MLNRDELNGVIRSSIDQRKEKAGHVRHFAKLVPCDTLRRGGRVVDRGGLENR